MQVADLHNHVGKPMLVKSHSKQYAWQSPNTGGIAITASDKVTNYHGHFMSGYPGELTQVPMAPDLCPECLEHGLQFSLGSGILLLVRRQAEQKC